MGRNRHTKEIFIQKHRPVLIRVEHWANAYQNQLSKLNPTLPAKYYSSLDESFLATGSAEAWPCTDGVVLLIKKNKRISFETKNQLNRSMHDFLINGNEMQLYGHDRKKMPDSKNFLHHFHLIHSKILNNRNSRTAHFFLSKTESGVGKKIIYKSKYDLAIFFGWNSVFTDPIAEAFNRFNSTFIQYNLSDTRTKTAISSKTDNTTNNHEQVEKEAQKNAKYFSSEFYNLLNSDHVEEDLQIYLNQKPEFIFPEYRDFIKKLELGSEYVTDYVFEINGPYGIEYIFVEIEKANKKVFTRKNTFTADFTQAKGQLLDWEIWLTKHPSYIKEKLTHFYKPKFLLIMGRNTNFSEKNKLQLRDEFTDTNKSFMTYDDLLDRFKQIAHNIGINL